MRVAMKSLICAMAASLVLCAAGDAAAAVPILPEGLVMQETFKPGFGTPVGKVRAVRGQVIVTHAHKPEGYWARENLPLYQGDTIISLDKSRISLKMNDQSIIALSSNTRLVLNKSIYDDKKKRRSSFLGLTLGKARFIVTKLLNFKRSEFKVKTVTAVCGVRGSDFVVIASDRLTEVTALDETALEIISLAAPDEPPMIITDYQRTGVFQGELPYQPLEVPAEEIELLIKDVAVTSDGTLSESDTPIRKLSKEKSAGTTSRQARGEAGQTGTGASARGEAVESQAAAGENEEEDTDREGASVADAPTVKEVQQIESSQSNAAGGSTSVKSDAGTVEEGAVATKDVVFEETVNEAETTVLLPQEVLVEPDVPTVIEPDDVIDIGEVFLEEIDVQEVAEQVAQEKLQEDLVIPDFPSLPE